MSDVPPDEESLVVTAAELGGGLSEPITGGGTDLALLSDSPEEYQEELGRVSEEVRDEAHDEYLARRVAEMEAAGASPSDIVDMLVDEIARGEVW